MAAKQRGGSGLPAAGGERVSSATVRDSGTHSAPGAASAAVSCHGEPWVLLGYITGSDVFCLVISPGLQCLALNFSAQEDFDKLKPIQPSSTNMFRSWLARS